MSDHVNDTPVQLDGVRKEDLPVLSEWMNDIEHLNLWTARRKLLLYEDLETFIRERCRSGLFTVIRSRETRRPVGFIDATMRERDGVAEFEVYLPPEWRRGGLLGVARFITHLFTDFAVRRIYCHVFAYNLASISVLQGAGFVEQGCFKDYVWWGDRYWDVYVYALDRDTWEAGHRGEGRVGRIRRLMQELGRSSGDLSPAARLPEDGA